MRSAASLATVDVTWLGALRDGAVPDGVVEFGPVVVHVNHIDHNVNGVFHLVAVQVHRVSSQLKEDKVTLEGWFKKKIYIKIPKYLFSLKPILVISCQTAFWSQ